MDDTAPTLPPRAGSDPRTLGSRGELIAAEYLTERGFVILERNWRNRHGELDIIARDRDALVAIEVKTRSGRGYGAPLEAITARKALRLRRLLLDWRRESGAAAPLLRIDAIGILMPPGASPIIDHLRGIS